MAQLYKGMTCPLCGAEIALAKDRYLCTTAFLDDDSDLWEYADAAMHWDCYASWEHRTRFARMYFEWNREGRWGLVFANDQVQVRVLHIYTPHLVEVILAETGSITEVALADWEGWLASKCFERCKHIIEHEALAAVLPLLRSRFPTAESISNAPTIV